MRNMKKIFLGVFAGITAGAIAGILFAPARGVITRRRILRKSRESAAEAKAAIEGASDTIRGEAEAVKHLTENILVNGAKRFISIIRSKKY